VKVLMHDDEVLECELQEDLCDGVLRHVKGKHGYFLCEEIEGEWVQYGTNFRADKTGPKWVAKQQREIGTCKRSQINGES